MKLLTILLLTVGATQIAVALLNFFLIRLLGWREDLRKLSLLPRQVFVVHLWFISITLLIFGILTCRFAVPMAEGTNPVAVWLAGAVALFWGIRTVLQATYYSPEHWRGKPAQTAVHVFLLCAYGGMTATYAWAVLGA
ncbi:MAG: hypothetical protein CMJ18_19815 [Phycisphaeraceae bacterium]|nr:hypothetical protein [Phycisphaeraceae bacterium]